MLLQAEQLFLHSGWNSLRDEFYVALKKYTPEVEMCEKQSGIKTIDSVMYDVE